MMKGIKPTSVDEYIKQAPIQAQDKLHQLRALLREVAPQAREALKWGVPVLEEKRILFSFAAFKNHINFMPTHSSLFPFREELSEYKTGADTIQLPYNKPLPEELIRKIALHRAHDVRENDSRWMESKKK